MRIDVSVMDGFGILRHAIEVKHPGKVMAQGTRQDAAYNGLRDRWGVTLWFINDPAGIPALVQSIKEATP